MLISWVLYEPEWTADGKYLLIRSGVNADLKDELLPVRRDRGLPDLPKDGVTKPDTKGIAGGIVLAPGVNSALGPEKYAFTKTTVRRNIYRVWVE